MQNIKSPEITGSPEMGSSLYHLGIEHQAAVEAASEPLPVKAILKFGYHK